MPARKSARDGETSGRTTNKEIPLPVEPTIQPITEEVRVPDFDQFRLDAGETVADLIAGDVEEAREALMRAMKTADRHRALPHAAELHVGAGEIVNALDGFRVFVSERGRS